MWARLLERNDLNAMDFLYYQGADVLRGPIKQLSINTSACTFSITTQWTARFNPVSMKWVRWLPSGVPELTVVIEIAEAWVDATPSQFIAINKSQDTRTLGCLIPHAYSKLEFTDLV